MQLLQGLLGQGGLSAQDPGQLGAEGAQLCDLSVTFVVCGQPPVGEAVGQMRGFRAAGVSTMNECSKWLQE